MTVKEIVRGFNEKFPLRPITKHNVYSAFRNKRVLRLFGTNPALFTVFNPNRKYYRKVDDDVQQIPQVQAGGEKDRFGLTRLDFLRISVKEYKRVNERLREENTRLKQNNYKIFSSRKNDFCTESKVDTLAKSLSVALFLLYFGTAIISPYMPKGAAEVSNILGFVTFWALGLFYGIINFMRVVAK